MTDKLDQAIRKQLIATLEGGGLTRHLTMR